MHIAPLLTLLALCIQTGATLVLHIMLVVMMQNRRDIFCMGNFKHTYLQTFWVPWIFMLIVWYSFLWQYQAVYADHFIYFVSFHILAWLFVAIYFHIIWQWIVTLRYDASCRDMVLCNSVVQTWALFSTIVITAAILLLIYAGSTLIT